MQELKLILDEKGKGQGTHFPIAKISISEDGRIEFSPLYADEGPDFWKDVDLGLPGVEEAGKRLVGLKNSRASSPISLIKNRLFFGELKGKNRQRHLTGNRFLLKFVYISEVRILH